MGVKSCSRNCCASIMCDTYVNSVGYVCNSCQEEFKLCVDRLNLSVNTESEIKNHLDSFMNTEKGFYDKTFEKIIDEFFKKCTD